MKLSETQAKVLRHLAKRAGDRQIAGHGRAPYIAAAKALERRGLAGSWRSGHWFATNAGRALANVMEAERGAEHARNAVQTV